MSFRDRFAIVTAISAFALSLFNFGEQHLWNQHSLKASVAAINPSDSLITASILLVNGGKHYETLYSARFIFSDDLSTGGGQVSAESIGPIVLAPGEAVVEELTAKMPSIEELREDGTVKATSSGIHLGVDFVPVRPSGEIPEDSRIFRFTELKYSGSRQVGASPRPGDSSGLIDLF